MKGVIFTYTLTVLGAVISPFYPFFGLIVYIMFGVMYPQALWFYSLPSTFLRSSFGYSEVVAYPMIIGWLISGCGNIKLGPAKYALMCLAGFGIWAFLSVIVNPMSPMSQNQLLMLARLFLAVVIILTLCNTTKSIRYVVWALIFAQGFVAYELNMSWLQGFNRMEVGYAGMDNNFFAVAMLIGSVLAFFEGMAQEKLLLKLVAFAAAALQAHVIMFSMSRGAMLGLCIVGITSFFVLPKNGKTLCFLLIAVILALYMAGPAVRARFATTFANAEERDSSSQGRIEAWKRCIKTMAEKPVFGVGIKNWLSYTTSHYRVHLEAHSTWMQTGAETGIPGVLLLAGFFVCQLWFLLPYIRGLEELPDPELKTYAQMTFVAIIGYCITAQFVSLYTMEIAYYTCTVGLVVLKISYLHKLEIEAQEYQEYQEFQDQRADMVLEEDQSVPLTGGI